MREEKSKKTIEATSMPIKEVIRFIEFGELLPWWISVFLVVISLIFYYSTTLSPWREIAVLAALIIFIFMSSWKFFK